MAKLAALLMVLVAATAFVAASAYTREGSCEREMQQQMPMRHCMMYMQSRMRSPYGYDRRFKEDHFRQCCNELGRFSSDCVCDAVQEMMEEMPQYGQMQEMERMACNLPRMCGMSDCGCSPY